MVQSVLVIPAAGKQGRAATQEFLKLGVPVHCLVRNKTATTAHDLAFDGAHIHKGDLGDIASVGRVLTPGTIDTVFLSLPAHPTLDSNFAANVISAAKESGVKHLIYISVARIGEHEKIPGWNDDYLMA